jgi:predicted dithiol-disulfide oxidoreductase (DUF899 family)
MSTERKDQAALHAIRFPGESAEYRAARDRLLREEAALRRHIEEVAALRRALPFGGAVAEDYVFEEGSADLDDVGTVRKVRLSELFERGKDTLVAYSFMYGPAMEKPCPMCTAMLDGLNGTAPHAHQRVNLVVVAKSPLERIRAHARARGWRDLRLLSSAGNSYNRDYHADAADGSQNPVLNVFVKRDAVVRHFYATELFFAKAEPGQNPRHVDSIWPLWNLFDLTPEGRGEDWYPRLSY